MVPLSNNLLFAGLGIVLMLSLSGVAWGQDSDGDGVMDPCDLCSGTEPNTVVDADGCSMELVYALSPATGAGGATLVSVAVESNGDVLVAAYDTGPIQVLRYESLTLASLPLLLVEVPKSPGAIHIVPEGMDVDPAGNIVIYTNGGTLRTVTTVTDTGVPVSQHDLTEDPNCAMSCLGVDLDGNVWVGGMQYEHPSWAWHIALIDKNDGSVIMEVDNADMAPAGVTWGWLPLGIDVDEDGLVYVGDHKKVVRFDPCDVGNTAEVIVPFGAGTGLGEFGTDGIRGLIVQGGRIYVGDRSNGRVNIYRASTGEFIQELADPSIVSVYDLDVDAYGNVYVNDVSTGKIYLWIADTDSDGDGVIDSHDLCPDSDPCLPVNDDGCTDSDQDGVPDWDDICPGTPGGTPVNAEGCIDTDQDGVTDPCDACPDTPPGAQVDPDGCPYETEFTAVLDVSVASAWGDYNNDGYSDMFGGNNLWANNGDGTFAHSNPIEQGDRISLGDYDNDGDIDVVCLPSAGSPRLSTNNGDGTWTIDHARFIPNDDDPYNVQAGTWGDFNGDGYLDVYWTGWYTGGVQDLDVIYMGSGGASFAHTWTAPWAHGKGVTVCDFDGDADIDISVSNYWMTNSFLWRNNGFDGVSGLTEIAVGSLDGGGHTQGSCWADFDNDGDFDLFVANFAHPGNPTARFQENQGSPGYGFTNKGLCGVTQVEPLSCGIAGDYDNDGDVDMLVTVSGGYSWTTIMMYRNNGDWTFTEVTSDVGLAGQGPQDIAAWGDYNNDGFLDLIANQKLWRNPGGSNHWIKVKLLGGPHADGLVNGAAIGAQVRIDVPGLGTLTRQVEGNTGQLGSQNDQTMHFGLGSYTGAVDLQIDWPNGYLETIYDVAVDQAVTIELQPPTTIPLCWDYLTQCHGDTDGDGDVDTVDWPIFRDSFGYAYPSAQYHPCGDMDHDGDVDTVDWPEFRDNFGYTAPADCTPGGTWPPIP